MSFIAAKVLDLLIIIAWYVVGTLVIKTMGRAIKLLKTKLVRPALVKA